MSGEYGSESSEGPQFPWLRPDAPAQESMVGVGGAFWGVESGGSLETTKLCGYRACLQKCPHPPALSGPDSAVTQADQALKGPQRAGDLCRPGWPIVPLGFGLCQE